MTQNPSLKQLPKLPRPYCPPTLSSTVPASAPHPEPTPSTDIINSQSPSEFSLPPDHQDHQDPQPQGEKVLLPLPPLPPGFKAPDAESPPPKAELFPYQKPHADQLAVALHKHKRALDASDTGTGKTFTALAVCAQLGLRPFIICPKSVLSSWMQVTRAFGLEESLLGIANYELLQNCRYFGPGDGGLRTKVSCPYLTRTVGNARDHPQNTKNNHTFTWSGLPQNTLVIFDEAHRCKNPRTVCSVLLFTLAVTDTRILMLSATISDKPTNFALAGYVLGLYPSLRHAMNWIRHAEHEIPSVLTMAGVHRKIYPEFASRMRIKDLGNLFPKNRVMADCYDMETAKEIQEQYQLIEEEVARLKRNEDASQCMLARILYARMRIEQLKIPTFLELIKGYLSEGNAVAVFVNFTNTLQTLAEELGTRCVIYGDQTRGERDGNIEAFQNDLSQIIICNIRSGGVGISLHDTHGNFPRVSIISPSWSAQDIIQALGRVHRANGKTPVRQSIVFCKGTVEEMICQNMIGKIKTIGGLNDGDLHSYNIEGLMDPGEVEVDPVDKELEREIIREQKIATLKAKKKRLKNDLRECNEELAKLLAGRGSEASSTASTSIPTKSKKTVGPAHPRHPRHPRHTRTPNTSTYSYHSNSHHSATSATSATSAISGSSSGYPRHSHTFKKSKKKSGKSFSKDGKKPPKKQN